MSKETVKYSFVNKYGRGYVGEHEYNGVVLNITSGLFAIQPLDDEEGVPNGQVRSFTPRDLAGWEWWPDWKSYRIQTLKTDITLASKPGNFSANLAANQAELAALEGGSNGR